jgi:hypothetical protein
MSVVKLRSRAHQSFSGVVNVAANVFLITAPFFYDLFRQSMRGKNKLELGRVFTVQTLFDALHYRIDVIFVIVALVYGFYPRLDSKLVERRGRRVVRVKRDGVKLVHVSELFKRVRGERWTRDFL